MTGDGGPDPVDAVDRNDPVDPNEPVGPDVDVAIVGAGPVGLVLAVLLAQRGRSVTVLERWPNPYPLPRAVHFDHEVGRILQSCGIGDEVRAISEPAEVYEWRNGQGTTLLRFGRVGTALSGWPFSSMFCQPELEALLQRRTEALATLEVRRGVRVDGLEQVGDTVVVHHDGPGSVRARYVVGCDGANSTVRSLLGVEVDDRGFFYDWLIVDVVLDHPRTFDPLNLQVCDPARPTTAVSGGPGRRRWEFMRLPEERIEDLNDEARAWELLAPWDVHPGNARLERHAVYTFQARAAARWQVGRAFLAGDAAHQMPPFAGQGMCAGLRDAANLAWKLAFVLDGRASERILDTYQVEREPHVRAITELAVSLGAAIQTTDADVAAARDASFGTNGGAPPPGVGLPAIGRGLCHGTDQRVGRPFPQTRPGGDDALGLGFAAIGPLADASGIDALRGRAVLRPDGPTTIVRPDRSVYAVADDRPALDAAMHALTRTLRSAT
jgi:flavoprotein hydroxylase